MALFIHTPQEVVQQDASPPLPSAPRALYLAEMSRGYALPSAFLLVPGLSAGDVAPTAERELSGITRHGGFGFSVLGAESYPGKVWTLRLPETHPVMLLLSRYASSLTNVSAERGHVLAYNAFHPDRSGVKGELRIDAITPLPEGAHGYSVAVSVVSHWPFPSRLNPPPLPDLPPVVVPPLPDVGLYLDVYLEVY